MSNGLDNVKSHDEIPNRSDQRSNTFSRTNDRVSMFPNDNVEAMSKGGTFLAREYVRNMIDDTKSNDLDALMDDAHDLEPLKEILHQTGACTEACRLWTASNCSHAFEFTEVKCLKVCSSVEQDGMHKIDGWGWNYVSCLESLVSGFEQRHSEIGGCWKMVTLCRDIFHTGTINEFGYGSSADIITSRKTDPAALFLSLTVGLLATSIIFFAIRGVPCSKQRICGEYTRRGRVFDHPRQESSVEEPLLPNE